MANIKSLAAGVAILGATVIGLASPVFALSSVAKTDSCYIVYTHLTNVVSAMHTISDKREAAYNDTVTRVTQELKAAQAAGYDTTQLEADYKTLNTNLMTFHTDRLTFEVDLTQALSVSPSECGSGTGQLVDALKSARAALPILRADDQKIRSDIHNQLLPDVKAYITWLQQKAATASNT